MKKKVLSIILCVAMVIAMTPSMVFADCSESAGTVTFSGTVTSGNLAAVAELPSTSKTTISFTFPIYVSKTDVASFEAFSKNFQAPTFKSVNAAGDATYSTSTNLLIDDVFNYLGASYATNTVLEVTASDVAIGKLDQAKGLVARITTDPKAAQLSAAAYVNAKYYGDLNAAVAAAKKGEVITLLDKYSGKEIVAAPGVIVNKNGFFANVDAGVAVAKVGSTFTTCSTLQQAYEVVNKDPGKYGEIKLLDDVDQNLHVISNKELKLDLNGNVLDGNITADGRVIIVDSSETGTDLGTGEVTGQLIYTDPSHISIVTGIFNTAQENDAIVAAGSKGFIMTLNGVDKWVVASADAVKAMTFGLEYSILDDAGNAVIDNDSEPGIDLAAGKEYTAQIYFVNGLSGMKLRAFDFTATYDPSEIVVSVPYSANNQYTTLGEEWNKGSMHYTMAVNDNLKTNAEGKALVAEFKFHVNTNNDSLKVRDDLILDFVRNATIGTMKSINEIPVAAYTPFTGFIANTNDGVEVVDYVYAPIGYKLAIISNDTTDGKFNLEGFDADQVYYTENPAYVAQSTNPEGKDIFGTPGKVNGVYLALVKTSTPSDVAELIKHNSVGYTVLDTTPYLNGNVDINLDGKVSANDASDVYQMLIHDGTDTSARGSKWGYDPADSQLYIPTLQRLLAESNFDGKLYGTIEDVNNIINYYSKLNLY